MIHFDLFPEIEAVQKENYVMANQISSIFKKHVEFINSAVAADYLRPFVRECLPPYKDIRQFLNTVVKKIPEDLDSPYLYIWSSKLTRYERAFHLLTDVRRFCGQRTDNQYWRMNEAFWNPLFIMVNKKRNGELENKKTPTISYDARIILEETANILLINERRDRIRDTNFWTPVVVAAKEEQLKKLQVVDQSGLTSDNCPICLDDYSDNCQSLVLKCNHFMHKNCSEYYFDTTTKCPICRKDIRDE